jgi:selenocysteine-specific elongation factor
VPRLAIDRSFALRGRGTVVTGTVGAGCFSEGQEVEILPGGPRGRIRGLEVHNRRCAQVRQGQRAAINLQGLDREEAPRGATVVRPGSLRATRRIWARLERSARTREHLPRGGPVRFHQGTAELGARVRVLRAPGDPEWVEIRLDAEAVLAPGDRFVLRRPAPVDTLGGGVVVDAHPPRFGPSCAEAFHAGALEHEHAVELRLARSGARGVEAFAVAIELGVLPERVEQLLSNLALAHRAERASGRWYSGNTWREIGAKAREGIEAFHRERPLEPGPSREALRAGIGLAVAQQAWRELLAGLAERGVVRLLGDRVALADHEIVLGSEEQRRAEDWCDRVRRASLEPVDASCGSGTSDSGRDAAILELLIARGELVRLPDRRLVHSEPLSRLRQALREHARESRTIDIGSFKRLAGVTRKNAIALLEQLDAERSTRRAGEVREILLDPAPPAVS